MSSTKGIFICYRRDDAEGYAGRIYDRLHARFPGRVFMDVTGISPGADFSRVIQDTVGSCHVLLAIIGKQWLTIADSSTKPRIQRDDDYVRHEIATALYRNIAVIPVLVRDAKMPGQESLPPDLASLSMRNALQVSDDDFEHDALRLISAIEYVMGETRVPQPPAPPPRTGNRTCLIVAIMAGILLVGGFVIALLFGAALWGGGGGGGGNGPYPPPPTETPTPVPQHSPEPPVPTSGFPVGHWTIVLTSTDGRQEEHELDIFGDGTFESNGGRQHWAYSADEDTITLYGWGIVTIQSQTADGYEGYGTLNGNLYHVALTPR
jgi:hypothetical protein